MVGLVDSLELDREGQGDMEFVLRAVQVLEFLMYAVFQFPQLAPQ